MNSLVGLYMQQYNQLNNSIMDLNQRNKNGIHMEQLKALNKEREELEIKIYKLNNPEETIANKFDNYNKVYALKYALILYRNTIKNEEEKQWLYNITSDSWMNLMIYLEDKDTIINIESLYNIYKKVSGKNEDEIKAKYLQVYN